MENDKKITKFVNYNEYCEENEQKVNKLEINNIIFLIIMLIFLLLIYLNVWKNAYVCYNIKQC